MATSRPGPGTTLPGVRLRTLFAGLLLAMLLAALDSTIVATALPTIVAELGGLERLSWVVTAYLLAVVAYPFVEEWAMGDHRDHHLLERPRSTPTRTGIGVAGIVFYGTLWAAGSADLIATQFGVTFEGVITFLQVALVLGVLDVVERWGAGGRGHGGVVVEADVADEPDADEDVDEGAIAAMFR